VLPLRLEQVRRNQGENSMGYKTILVNCDTAPTTEKRIELAAELAQQAGAHLVGLFVRPNVVSVVTMEAGMAPDILAIQEQRGKEDAAAAKAVFDRVVGRAGGSSEWREARGDVYDHTAVSAHYADLTIMGQYDPKQVDVDVIPDLPEAVMMHSGRPVLVVPYIGVKSKLMGGHVLVGWNASREASRAVADAMPFLKAASAVTVLVVNPKGTTGHGEQPGGDIVQFLTRHGVKVTASFTVADHIDAGDALLSRVSDVNADLLVLGAYGHSRLREFMIGGVTRKVLATMTVPVLFSH
jgi:nucleotide-binding universal stress UspA family protein